MKEEHPLVKITFVVDQGSSNSMAPIGIGLSVPFAIHIDAPNSPL